MPGGTFYLQTAYQIYNDDGGANAATPKVAESTPYTTQVKNQNVRIRIQTKYQTGTGSVNFTLYYSRDGGAMPLFLQAEALT